MIYVKHVKCALNALHVYTYVVLHMYTHYIYEAKSDPQVP